MKCSAFYIFCFSTFIAYSSCLEPIIIVHGGAGDIDDSRVKGKLDGIKVAAREGYAVLQWGGSALDAVEAAVVAMEKDEYFNAGYGSVLNIQGNIEMEASIMNGADLNVGGVTLVKDFFHPISIAHKVLTDSPHSLLGGEGAKIFALEKGFQTIPQDSLITSYSMDAWYDYLRENTHEKNVNIFESLTNGTEGRPKYEGGVGTVGAVAIDAQGHIAAATSTGGLTGKAVGRMGDVPMIGSGTYADDLIGGVSSTGHGESILKYCLAHTIIKLMEQGVDAQNATTNAINAMTARLNNTAGAITLSMNGNVGIHFSSQRMAWAYMQNNKTFYGIERNEILED